MIGIYKIVNKINNKCYIGQSWDIEKRWKHHLICKDTRKHLYSSFKKYGVENFDFIILRTFNDSPLTQIFLDSFEEKYVLECGSLNSEKGYNKKHGGSHGKYNEETKEKLSVLGKKRIVSEETKQKIRRRRLGTKQSEETRKKMSKSLMGNKNALGYKFSEESKLKIKEKRINYKVSEETKEKMRKIMVGKKFALGYRYSEEKKLEMRIKRGYKVFCLDNETTYYSTYDASEKLNINQSDICLVCNNKKKSVKGFHFRYLNK